MSRTYAIFSAQYLPHVGGVETFTANLAHQLVLGGDGVCVVTSARAGAPEVETQEDGVRIVRLPSTQLMGGRLPLSRHGSRERSLLSAVSGLGVDRVLVNTRFYGTSVTGLRFAREHDLPAVLLDHGSAWLTFGCGAVPDAAAHAWERHMTARDVSLGATFAGISEKSAAWLSTFGIKTSLVIPNAIDAASFRGESSGRDFRFELGIPNDKTLVVFVGRLAPEKGPERLLAAMGQLGEKYACVLAGEGGSASPARARPPRECAPCGKPRPCGISLPCSRRQTSSAFPHAPRAFARRFSKREPGAFPALCQMWAVRARCFATAATLLDASRQTASQQPWPREFARSWRPGRQAVRRNCRRM